MDGAFIGIRKWIANDTILQILLMRAVGLSDSKMALLLRIKYRQLMYYINTYMSLGWVVYNRYYRIVDYLYLLSNSMYLHRKELQGGVITAFAYDLSMAVIIDHLQSYISTIPKAFLPQMPNYTLPIFKSNRFYLLWNGSIPVIAL